jgi:hypothetical protein
MLMFFDVFEVILYWFKRALADTCNGYNFSFFLLKIKRNGSSLFSFLTCINCNGYIVSFFIKYAKMKRLHRYSFFKSPIASITLLQADEKRNSLVTTVTNNVTVTVTK